MDTLHLLYDGDCGFCRWSVVQLLAWDDRGDGVLAPVAIQSARGARLLAGIPAELRLKTAHVVGGDGIVHSGGDAAAIVADVLPAGASLALFARTLPWLVRGVYGVVAGNRVRVGRFVPAGARRRADAELARREGPGARPVAPR